MRTHYEAVAERQLPLLFGWTLAVLADAASSNRPAAVSHSDGGCASVSQFWCEHCLTKKWVGNFLTFSEIIKEKHKKNLLLLLLLFKTKLRNQIKIWRRDEQSYLYMLGDRFEPECLFAILDFQKSWFG